MRILILLSVVILTLGVGCSSSRSFVKAKKIPLEELLSNMNDQQVDYDFFSAKAKMRLESEEMNMSGRANIRMIKDSLIWMNFKKLGIEGGRALIRPDSFWIVYRLENLYESGTYEELTSAYDLELTFSEFQNLIVGNLPLPDVDQVSHYETRDLHTLRFVSGGNAYSYQIDGNNQIRAFEWKDGLYRSVTGMLEDYDLVRFAKKKTASVNAGDDGSGTVKISFISVKFDEPKKIRFEVPSHYTRLP